MSPKKLTKDQLKSPVPSDIEVSQSLEGSLSHVSEIAGASGVLDSEMEPHGRYKGKVRCASRADCTPCSGSCSSFLFRENERTVQ